MATKKFAIPEDPDFEYFYTASGLQSRRILKGADAKDSFDEIPVIDISPITSVHLEDRKKLAAEINRAARDVGFFILENPPVDSKLMDDAFAAIEKFFSLSAEEKTALDQNNSWTAKGYYAHHNDDGMISNETFKMGNDYTESEQKDCGVEVVNQKVFNQWPEKSYPEFRKVIYDYFNSVDSFCGQLLGIFALALGLEEDGLDHMFKRPLKDITIQHYNKGVEKPGLGAHADFGAFTCLLQHKVSGLEVLNANAQWVPVPVKEHAFVVNTGSYFEILSNGRWPSTVHRVRCSGDTDRNSLPFFYNFDPETIVRPLVLEADDQPKYDEVHIGKSSVKGTYMFKGDEHALVKMINSKGLTLDDISYHQVLRGVEV
ncbi:hypothetical protein BX600DRAFT_493777 [Xylariales sp. PMI_506]|nr:hypothetical protein BX600DRAFT_493777 [Xylariales sp. PMI_506]